jgi:hypothetical protein
MLMQGYGNRWARRVALLEGDADSLVLTPDHPARLAPPLARHRQHEAIRKPERAIDFDRGAGSGEIADRAGDGLAAELDCSGFQHAVAGRSAVFVHDAPEDGSFGKANEKT